ncbi:MAG: hypothetical protein AABZ47_04180 [Planctomycetota bacterium]
MANRVPMELVAAQSGFAAQDAELNATRERQLRAVVRQAASGSSHIDLAFSLAMRFRLVFLRAHYSGGTGQSPFVLTLDSGMGSAFDAGLFTVTQAGTLHDVNLRVEGVDLEDPSPWTFQAGDQLRIQWTNPDLTKMTWGVEVGLALVS